MTITSPKPTREERAAMTHDELLRAVWLLDDIIDSMRWIPVLEKLPEKGLTDPITNDYVEYLCTLRIGDRKSVRLIKFDHNGHWMHGGMNFDENVVAWMTKPEPYKNSLIIMDIGCATTSIGILDGEICGY